MPQNIDLEDKIVGPLTLTQFLYLLGGGLIDYMLFQTLGKDYFVLFVVLAAPIALVALALAFLKIQDQPISHFVSAGLTYLSKPKQRIWRRLENFKPILTEPPKKEIKDDEVKTRHVDKSELEQLAYMLDTSAPGQIPGQTAAVKHMNLGGVTRAFERLLENDPGLAKKAESTKQK